MSINYVHEANRLGKKLLGDEKITVEDLELARIVAEKTTSIRNLVLYTKIKHSLHEEKDSAE
ncbi:hypothetical protein [Peribacillus frigoritolerans]|uniref:Uncharacterized protein n=1 Tax=Peribacillus frigoritolerans TaxID=450367 RepID=A0AAJ1QQE1_9BACI|nr:hypothetical protein [Peribacillus frigoritolerans]MDM5285656.1 hypothetical protein [Peribacillus frigoritolerans]